MDPISNTDRLVQLLRQKLSERAKARSPAGAAHGATVDAKGMDKVLAVTGRSAEAGADDAQLQRILIEQLLADQFGPAMVNEPKFQQVVDRVHDIMKSDPDVGLMLNQTLSDVRKKGF